MGFDARRGCGSLASAGHLPPVVVTRDEALLLEPRYGPLFGALDSHYEAREFAHEPGCALVLYTDGATEARCNRELFGEQRLLEALSGASDLNPQTLVDHPRDAVLGYAGRLQDDMEILALRRPV